MDRRRKVQNKSISSSEANECATFPRRVAPKTWLMRNMPRSSKIWIFISKHISSFTASLISLSFLGLSLIYLWWENDLPVVRYAPRIAKLVLHSFPWNRGNAQTTATLNGTIKHMYFSSEGTYPLLIYMIGEILIFEGSVR